MELSKVLILSLFLTPLLSFASKLPELATKQDITNLRFLSNNGKFTYYQNQSGELLISTNYKVSQLLKLKPHTNYSFTGIGESSNIVIEADETFHKMYSPRKLNSIYISKVGSETTTLLTKGITPKLHQGGSLLSVYNSKKKRVMIYNIERKSLELEIKIHSKANPYFRPQVAMLSRGDIFYTDINSKGLQAILHLNTKTNKTKVVYKLPTALSRLELCESTNDVYIGEFPYNRGSSKSIISSLSNQTTDFSKKTILYSSDTFDIGNLRCNFEKGKIGFIKNTDMDYTEFTEIDLATKKSIPLTDLKFVTDVVQFGKKVITFYAGKTYLIKGENNLSLIDNLEDKK